jgi:hypothetical protein
VALFPRYQVGYKGGGELFREDHPISVLHRRAHVFAGVGVHDSGDIDSTVVRLQRYSKLFVTAHDGPAQRGMKTAVATAAKCRFWRDEFSLSSKGRLGKAGAASREEIALYPEFKAPEAF